MLAESEIVHETGNHWVTHNTLKGRHVYKVWKLSNSGTHGRLVATFDLGARGLSRAILDCGSRDAVTK